MNCCLHNRSIHPVSLMFGHMTCFGLLMDAEYFAEPWLWDWPCLANGTLTDTLLAENWCTHGVGLPSCAYVVATRRASFPGILSHLTLGPRMHTCEADLSPAKSNGTSPAGPTAWNRDVEQPHVSEDKCCWVKPVSSGSLCDSNGLCSHHKGKLT